MTGDVVSTLDSPSGRYRAEIVRHSTGSFCVEVLRFTEERDEDGGKIAEFWTPVNRGITCADTIERAESLAREKLAVWEPATPGPE